MAVDTPAKIAIIGAGPTGLEAALYARFLGYEVEVFEQHLNVAGEIWDEAPTYVSFADCSSPLALAALRTNDPSYAAPEAESILNERQWSERYLTPLGQTDLISDHVRLKTTVLAIGKVEISKTDSPQGEFDRGSWDFRLLVQERDSSTRIVIADVVLDCSGVSYRELPLGQGGIPAAGEDEGDVEVHYHSRRLHRHTDRYLGKSVLVVGDHESSAQAILALAELIARDASTRVTWVTRKEECDCPDGPLPGRGVDPLERRAAAFRAANQLAGSGVVSWWPGTWVESLHPGNERRSVVEVAGSHEGSFEFDEIISLNGFRPDWSLARELQLDICPITDAPRPFSKHLLQRSSSYSVDYPAPDASALITSEPNYYVLGSKSFGRMPGFLFQHGLRQIRDVFTIIGDRADLDLYAQMK